MSPFGKGPVLDVRNCQLPTDLGPTGKTLSGVRGVQQPYL